MRIFVKSGLCFSLTVSILSGTGFAASDSFKSKIVGEWHVFMSAECDMKDSSKWTFYADGTATGLAGKDSKEKFKWTAVEDDVFQIKTPSGNISYFAVDTFDNAGKRRSSSLLEDEARWNSIKDEYANGSAYSGVLYVFYLVPSSKVKGDKYDKKIIRSIAGAAYAAEVKEFANMKQLVDESNARAEKEQKEYLSSLEKKWGKKTAQAILEKRIFTGMLIDQVKESIGEPGNIDTLEKGSVKVEVWEYSDRTLYFKNGRLDTIHTTTR